MQDFTAHCPGGYESLQEIPSGNAMEMGQTMPEVGHE